jgi:hypothetical protein
MPNVTRRNRAPVFLHGLQGGGTGILWNFITSHPDFLGPRYETNQIFMYDWWRFAKALPRLGRFGYQIPNMLALIPLSRRYGVAPSAWKIFAYDDHRPRAASSYASAALGRAVDERLHVLKVDHALRPGHDRENEKRRGVLYSRDEVETTRLAAKNIEGLCFLQPFFRTTFPDAKFVAISRDGLASCESKLRHGRARSATHAAEVYRDEIGYMLESSRAHPDFCMLLRYEDLMRDPLGEIRRVYDFLGLTLGPDQEFRMATREFLGRERTELAGKAVQKGKNWLSQSDLVESFVQTDVNRRARDRLAAADRKSFLRIAGPVMEELRYST